MVGTSERAAGLGKRERAPQGWAVLQKCEILRVEKRRGGLECGDLCVGATQTPRPLGSMCHALWLLAFLTVGLSGYMGVGAQSALNWALVQPLQQQVTCGDPGP